MTCKAFDFLNIFLVNPVRDICTAGNLIDIIRNIIAPRKNESHFKVRVQFNWTNDFVVHYNWYSRKILGRLKG